MSIDMQKYSTPKWWQDYAVPPLAAGMAITPLFYGFARKSHAQLGKPMPKMTITKIALEGLKLGPVGSLLVGAQLLAQPKVEKQVKKMLPQQKPWVVMAVSTALVGAGSVPMLAVFNGLTTGLSIRQSLSTVTWKTGGAIITREMTFLLSLRISDPLSQYMEQRFGKSRKVKCGSDFLSGAIGGVVGHPADTAVTLWQNKQQITKISQLGQGVLFRLVTLGLFNMGYNQMKPVLKDPASVINNILDKLAK